MDPTTRRVLLSSSKKGDPVYVDDVFSTFLFNGNRSTLQITNGIDLAGEGGMVWSKVRDSGNNYGTIYDTENGTGPQGGRFFSSPVGTNGTGTQSDGLTSFNSDGYTLGGNLFENSNDSTYGEKHVSWTFRKAPGFFDVVTYTGNGTYYHNISHNLGSVPGSIWIKRVDQASHWTVYHRGIDSSAPHEYKIYLEETGARIDNDWLADTAPTATQFTLGSESDTNANGGTFVAYLFAHDDQSFGTNGNESIIKCGSYTGNGGTQTINLGFEPQWVLIKRATGSDFYGWQVYDNMRGMPVGGVDAYLRANLNSQELFYDDVDPTPTGLTIKSGSGGANASGATYIYMVIRRPHKPPSAGTDVFHVDAGTNNSQDGVITTGFPVDFSMFGYRTLGGTYATNSRLTGYPTSATATSGWGDQLATYNSGAESSGGYPAFHSPDNTTIKRGGNGNNANGVSGFFFKRAPGFFDVVAYDGTSPAQAVNHNLAATPELMIVKCRTNNGQWAVYDATNGPTKGSLLNSTSGAFTYQNYWNNTAPTNTQFTVATDGAVNDSGQRYIAHLFATLPGVSKVGSYSGTGSNIDVDCGFTAGARFVLIKRTDSTGGWYVYDSVRGIVSGNDPYLFLHTGDAEVTNTDYIDPLNAGFTVTSSAPAALNASGGTYIFLAIA